jgi:hypothetical protein
MSRYSVYIIPDTFVKTKKIYTLYKLSEKGVQTLVWQNQAKAGRLRPKYLSDKLYVNSFWRTIHEKSRFITLWCHF